jgi:hypothetical protein
MKCADILNEAATLVGGARNDQHGDKHDNFINIARYWTAHLHAKGLIVGSLDAEDVALMMVLLKVARTKTGCFNKDDYLDLCGYGGIAYELADSKDHFGIDPGDGYVKG